MQDYSNTAKRLHSQQQIASLPLAMTTRGEGSNPGGARHTTIKYRTSRAALITSTAPSLRADVGGEANSNRNKTQVARPKQRVRQSSIQ